MMFFHEVGSSAADNQVIFEVTVRTEQMMYWELGSAAGAMDVFVSGTGIDYQATALALIDLGSTAPSTAVVETTAGGNYGIKSRWKKIKVLQKGATAVTGAYLIGWDE